MEPRDHVVDSGWVAIRVRCLDSNDMIKVPQSTVTPVHTFSEELLGVQAECTAVTPQVLDVVILLVDKVNPI